MEENLLHEKIEIIVEKSSKKAKQVSFIREFRVHGNMTFKLLISPIFPKVHILWEGHRILRNLNNTFDWHNMGQK